MLLSRCCLALSIPPFFKIANQNICSIFLYHYSTTFSKIQRHSQIFEWAGICMAILDKFLNQFGLSWSGSYKDYYSEDTGAVASPRGPIDQSCNEYERPSKIAILVNSRCVKENLSKDANLSMSRLIEKEMTYFSFIPYQICNCAYIGEHKAWAMYNLNNKRILSLAINEINYHLGTLHDLEEDSAIEKIIPADYQINFNSICLHRLTRAHSPLSCAMDK